MRKRLKEELIKKKVAALSEADIQKLKADFMLSIAHDKEKNQKYIMGGFDNPVIKKEFFQFMEARLLPLAQNRTLSKAV